MKTLAEGAKGERSTTVIEERNAVKRCRKSQNRASPKSCSVAEKKGYGGGFSQRERE